MLQHILARSPLILAALLAGSGTLHWLHPEPFDAMIPPQLPGPRAWTYASGLVELATAATIAHPRTRADGGLIAMILFCVVFPGNIQMALDAEGTAQKATTYVRLPLQIPLILWAWQVRRQAGGSGTRPGVEA